MKTARFLSAAAFAAIAFTLFACSSDDPDDNTGGGGGGIVNPSELSNKQVYLVERGSTDEDKDTYRKTGEYSGNIDIAMRIYGRTGTDSSIPAGKIQNGKLSLDLPSISSEYFYKFSGNCEDFDPATSYDFSSCEGTLSVPENLYFFDDFSLEVDIPGKECYIRLFSVRSGEWLRGTGLYYVSKAGAVTGTETYTYRNEEEVYSHTWNANFSQGWNVLFYDYGTRTSTTALPAGTALEWGLYCYDQDPPPPPPPPPPEVEPSSVPIKTLAAVLPGTSYADLDGVGRFYTLSQLAANASKIDIVYDAADNKIWSAIDFGFEYDDELLWDNFTLIAPLSDILGSAIIAQIHTVLTTESEISETDLAEWFEILDADALDDAISNSDGYIDLAEDKVFVVYTTESGFFLAAVNAADASISYLRL